MKIWFVNYLLAFFLGRIPGKIFAVVSGALGIDMYFGWSQLSYTVVFYSWTALSFAAWGFFTALIVIKLEKSRFDTKFFFQLAGIYFGVGMPFLYLGLNGYMDPRIMLLALPLQFAGGCYFAMRRRSGATKLT